MDNYVLMVSAISNQIYLGTMKKNSKIPVMNDRRKEFTDQVIRAAAEHMMNLPAGTAYEFPGCGKLVWESETEAK